ncbi:hypothetical protein CSA37_02155 [Candidatus Fermentibacteria bacterium]|nr:MAG: hypothetical protein CSA37_02155 [Candidatus Fermentibacteria bacterium]
MHRCNIIRINDTPEQLDTWSGLFGALPVLVKGIQQAQVLFCFFKSLETELLKAILQAGNSFLPVRLLYRKNYTVQRQLQVDSVFRTGYNCFK